MDRPNKSEFGSWCACIFIIGNKLDLESERAVDLELAEKKAKDCGYEHYQVSAKSGDNIHEMFYEVTKKVVEMKDKRCDKIESIGIKRGRRKSAKESEWKW